MVLNSWEGNKLKVLELEQESGISSIAFTFEDVMRRWGDNIQEIAMDSTCQLLFCRLDFCG
jgi:hypothetical protein